MRVLLRNAATLYGAHVLGLVVPLLTVPYLARVLRPEGWGAVLFAQSFAAWTTLVLEYGFDLSGTRAVARARHVPEDLPSVVAGVQGARLLVLVGAQVVVLAVALAVRMSPALLVLFAWAWAYAVAKGLSPLWFFFGQERMRGAALVDAGAKVLAALGVFVWVRGPADGWKVLALQATTAAVALLWLTLRMYGSVPVQAPTLHGSWATLREAFGIFVFRAASGLYVNANAFILGLLATPAVVGFFGGAERIIRAAVNLFYPLSQTLFPRLSHLTATDPPGAERVLRYGLWGMLGGGVAMGGVAALGAPILVRVLLGPGYDAAVPVLRILALLPPVIAVGTIFGIQWALPAGLERPFVRLVLLAGALNLALAPVVVPRWGAQGMAVAVVAAEVLVAGGLLGVFRSRGGGLWPLRLPGSERP